ATTAGCYNLTVQVRAEESPTSAASRVIVLTVGAGGGLDMDVQPAAAPSRPEWLQRVPRRAVMLLPVVLILALSGLALALRAAQPLISPTAAPRAAAHGPGGTIARITSRTPRSVP